jgi:hypothetical protein
MKTKAELTWCSIAPGARPQKFSELDDQHLSNILWFNEVFNGYTRYNSEVYFLLGLELAKRKIERLPWRPLPVLREIQTLKKMKMINVSGSIIKGGPYSGNKFDHQVIGSVTHIEGWKDL